MSPFVSTPQAAIDTILTHLKVSDRSKQQHCLQHTHQLTSTGNSVANPPGFGGAGGKSIANPPGFGVAGGKSIANPLSFGGAGGKSIANPLGFGGAGGKGIANPLGFGGAWFLLFCDAGSLIYDGLESIHFWWRLERAKERKKPLHNNHHKIPSFM